MWGEVRRFAASNHGLVDRATALANGVTDRMITTALNGDRWEQVHPGVYYLNVTPRTWLTDTLAAVMAAGPESLASHRTAATLWNFDGFGSRLIEVTVPHDNHPVPDGILVHRSRRELMPARVAEIPVTTPERTLHDLAPLMPRLTLEKALMSALHQKHTTPDRVAEQVRLQGGRGVRGSRKLLSVLSLADEGRTASGGEVELWSLIRKAPVPGPVLQLQVPLPTGSDVYPDFAWPDRMRIVELDGFDAHSTPEQLNADLVRQNALMDLGWEIRRFTGRRIRREPDTVVAEITAFVNAPFSRSG